MHSVLDARLTLQHIMGTVAGASVCVLVVLQQQALVLLSAQSAKSSPSLSERDSCKFKVLHSVAQ